MATPNALLRRQISAGEYSRLLLPTSSVHSWIEAFSPAVVPSLFKGSYWGFFCHLQAVFISCFGLPCHFDQNTRRMWAPVGNRTIQSYILMSWTLRGALSWSHAASSQWPSGSWGSQAMCCTQADRWWVPLEPLHTTPYTGVSADGFTFYTPTVERTHHSSRS